MAPEQARGKVVDKRSDIWAFGCVLFEMLTGTRPFDGETITDVLGAVVRAEPDWSRLPDTTPGNIRRLLRRCLTKEARARQQAAGDARLEIEEAIRGAVEPSVASTSSRRSRALLAAAAALAATAVSTLAFLAYAARRPADPGPVSVTRFTVPSPDGEDLATAAANDGPVAISPNGEFQTPGWCGWIDRERT
jgi:serine/threonine protein kinase